jgi:predicted peptidase
MKKEASNIIFILVLAAVVGICGWLMVGGPSKKAPVASSAAAVAKGPPPRDLEPAGAYTRLFRRMTHVVPETGATIEYFVYLPRAKIPKGQSLPLVVAFHGGTGKAYAAEHLLAGRMSVDYPAFIVTPVLPAQQFFVRPGSVPKSGDAAPTFRLPDVVSMIGMLRQKLPVDPARIYAIGCSEGGYASFGMARYYPDVIAAAVPLSGGWPAADAANLTSVPTWVVHTDGDKIFPVTEARKTVEAVQQAGGRLMYTEITGLGHACNDPQMYSQTMLRWMLTQKKKPAPVAAQ